MQEKIHRVAIVVDREFSGENVFNIANKMHTWLIETDEGKIISNEFLEYYTGGKDDLLDSGITTFQSHSSDPEKILDEILDEVNEHHNEYSHTPGWSEVHIFGLKLTPCIRNLLNKFDFLSFEEIDEKTFVARK